MNAPQSTYLLTSQEYRIVRAAITGLGPSTYQPHADDLDAANSLIERGMLEKEPRWDTLRATDAGTDAYDSDTWERREYGDARRS